MTMWGRDNVGSNLLLDAHVPLAQKNHKVRFMVMHDEKKDCHENVREFYVNMTTCFGTVNTNRYNRKTGFEHNTGMFKESSGGCLKIKSGKLQQI